MSRELSRLTYEPITGRAQPSWPHGKGLAVYFAVGVESYRAHGTRTEELYPSGDSEDLTNAAWREYGNRVGGFRLLDALADAGLPSTLLVNSDLYDTAPDLLHHARTLGAEFVAHGRSNSDSLAELNEPEIDYLNSVADRIETVEGTRPLGWSSPWLEHTAQTLDLLPIAGYRYLLDMRVDDRPVHLRSAGGELTALPYALELNDSTTVVGRQATAREFAEMIIDEFDELLDASRSQPLVMSVVTHSFISGAPFRLRALRTALEHLSAHRDEVWFTQPAEIYSHLNASAVRAGGDRRE
jgi:peptidoglycan/xylan/chitin deacetylase (PgdA/CDA1 family)